ncbi:MAG TPA: isoleucine--tRNA ligase, partial [bacterium]|nr:isoleucine--tRNA ligase [bacterium]
MFKQRDAKVNFPEIEQQVLDFWEKQQIFEKSIKNRAKAPIFNFYDGPPFATGLPHYGHILAGAIKDAIPRYKTMKGFKVERPNGWDCHGLPVEYEIEKELNISGKPEIEVMGVENFNKACRGIVFRYTSEWEKTIKRMGRWVDFEHSYATMNRDYMESIWWVFKQIWDKDLIYQDYRSTWYCPRCGTPLSNFEVNQGYKDNVQDPSVYVKLQLEDDPNTFLLIWTTTPWTLPGNSAVAINPSLEYVKIKLGDRVQGSGDRELTDAEIASVGQQFILARERLSVIEQPYEIVKKLKAKDLKGKKYRPVYSFIPTEKKAYYVAEADFVSADDGTGIVHMAPAFGEDDFNLGKELDLPVFRTVDEEGRMSPEVTQWAGTFVKQADDLIKEELTKRELLYKHGTIRHTYPFCWRCDSPLLNYSLKTWFVRVTAIREQLIENNQKIQWVPGHIRDGRFGKWLESVRDWNISRNRYWGTPLPIWECESCGTFDCVGSIAELKEKAAYGSVDAVTDLDLHRPYIDEIKLTCPKCGKPMHRIEEVLDCWFESGSMPYAQQHYPFERKEEFEDNFPADFIAEGMDQTR